MQEFSGSGDILPEFSYDHMGCAEDDSAYAPSGSVLNLRLGGDGSQAPLPPLAPNLAIVVSHADLGDNDSYSVNPALNTGMSTASMYEPNKLKTSDGLGSKVSLWDLRCDVKTLVETADGPLVQVPVEMLQRVREIMREHVGHRRLQRGLTQQAKVRLARFHSMHGASAAAPHCAVPLSVTYTGCLWRCSALAIQPLSASGAAGMTDKGWVCLARSFPSWFLKEWPGVMDLGLRWSEHHDSLRAAGNLPPR